jgi:hypothetical protein
LREARAAGRIAVYKNDERRRVSQQQASPSVSQWSLPSRAGRACFWRRAVRAPLFPTGKRRRWVLLLTFPASPPPPPGLGDRSLGHKAFRFLTVADATQEPAIRVGRACGDARVTHRWLRRPESVRHQPLVWWLYQHHAVCR